MTVVSTVVRAAAVWTGAEAEIPTGIQVQERSQLVVSLVPDAGEHQALTLGLHYSMRLSPAGVATVVPLAAFPATPGTVSMVRQTPMTQDYDPTATDTYDAVGHAAALDRSAMRVAELSQKVDDIEASSIVVAGGAESVPEGAVYVSNGEGGAVAGPTAAEIETARAAAVGAAGMATGAAGVAAGAATTADAAAALADQLSNAAPNVPVGTGFSARHWVAVAQALSDAFDLDAYSTTEQIAAMLGDFVPRTRKLRFGSGLYLDDAPGADAEPAEGDLSTDRLIRLAFASPAEAIAGILTGKPVDPASLAAAVAAHSSSIPPGAVIGFDLDEPPDDFIVGDGAAISVAAYPELDAAMYCGDANNATATAWYRCSDPANPTTTRSTTGGYIVTRDWRGVFPRFLDGGRGLDSGRVLGSYQADAFASHTHSVAPSWRSGAGTAGGWYVTANSGNSSVASSLGATGGTETRPKNISLLGCIKC